MEMEQVEYPVTGEGPRACWDAHERLSTESMNQNTDPHGSSCIDGIFGMEQALADGVCLLFSGISTRCTARGLTQLVFVDSVIQGLEG